MHIYKEETFKYGMVIKVYIEICFLGEGIQKYKKT